jgi:histidyl-tRNA synthetase
MSDQNSQTLKGFRDFTPSQMAVRNRIKRILVDVFESFGFEPISTPSLEYADVLLGKYGSEADKLVYTFEDRGGRLVGMPYDLTVPTARFATNHQNELPLPFKRYQIQRVWRAENTQKGRYREFEQCDIDILGTSSLLADAQIVAIIDTALSRLTIPNYQIKFNSRPMLYACMSEAGISEDKYIAAAIAIDKLDKETPETVKSEMANRGIDESAISKLFEIIDILEEEYPSAEALVEGQLLQNYPTLNDQVLVLKEIATEAIRMGVTSLTPSFTLARGLDYYTGVIFESVVTKPKMGSITGGGRYDQLIPKLGGPDWPAVGTTFGLDRISDIIAETGIWSEIPTSSANVFVPIFSSELLPEVIKTAKWLRDNGINAEEYLDPHVKLEKQMKYADKKQIPWVVIIGPQEASDGTVVLKNLKAGTQETILWEDLAGKLR